MRETQALRPDEGAVQGNSESPGEPSNERVAAAEAQAAATVARYREMVAAQPGLVAGMVRGDTVEEIDASAADARRAYTEVSRRVTEQY